MEPLEGNLSLVNVGIAFVNVAFIDVTFIYFDTFSLIKETVRMRENGSKEEELKKLESKEEKLLHEYKIRWFNAAIVMLWSLQALLIYIPKVQVIDKKLGKKNSLSAKSFITFFQVLL